MPDATSTTSALPSRAGLVPPSKQQLDAARFVSRHARDWADEAHLLAVLGLANHFKTTPEEG